MRTPPTPHQPTLDHPDHAAMNIKLDKQLELSQDQQDKAYQAIMKCWEADRQDASIQRADGPANNPAVKPSSWEVSWRRQLEALRGVLTSEQLAIYQESVDLWIKSYQVHAAKP